MRLSRPFLGAAGRRAGAGGVICASTSVRTTPGDPVVAAVYSALAAALGGGLLLMLARAVSAGAPILWGEVLIATSLVCLLPIEFGPMASRQVALAAAALRQRQEEGDADTAAQVAWFQFRVRVKSILECAGAAVALCACLRPQAALPLAAAGAALALFSRALFMWTNTFLVAPSLKLMPIPRKMTAFIASLDLVLVLMCVTSGVGTCRGWTAPALGGAAIFLAGSVARCSKTLQGK